MKKTLALVLVVVMVAMLFVGCGGKESDSDKILGKWSCEQDGAEIVMEFKKDGKATMSILYNGESLGEQEIEYKIDGSKLVVTVDGEEESSDFKIEGKTLTITEDGENLEFTRK